MQATNDIFRGCQHVTRLDEIEWDFSLGRLRDGKGAHVVETVVRDGTALAARLRGRTLARDHAALLEAVADGRVSAQPGLWTGRGSSRGSTFPLHQRTGLGETVAHDVAASVPVRPSHPEPGPRGSDDV